MAVKKRKELHYCRFCKKMQDHVLLTPTHKSGTREKVAIESCILSCEKCETVIFKYIAKSEVIQPKFYPKEYHPDVRENHHQPDFKIWKEVDDEDFSGYEKIFRTLLDSIKCYNLNLYRGSYSYLIQVVDMICDKGLLSIPSKHKIDIDPRLLPKKVEIDKELTIDVEERKKITQQILEQDLDSISGVEEPQMSHKLKEDEQPEKENGNEDKNFDQIEESPSPPTDFREKVEALIGRNQDAIFFRKVISEFEICHFPQFQPSREDLLKWIKWIEEYIEINFVMEEKRKRLRQQND